VHDAHARLRLLLVDDLYLKETGDWLADDRADVGASVAVVPTPLIALSTDQIDAEGNAGWNPPDRSFTVRNVGIGTVNYTITSDVDWLSVNPETGDCSEEEDTIAVIFDATGLLAGTHTGQITVEDPLAGNSPQAITVVLT